MHSFLRFCAGVYAAAVLASCGGGGGTTYVPVPFPAPAPQPEPTPDPLLSHKTQTLDWQTCPDTLMGPETEALHALRELAGDRLQCALMRAPIDYGNVGRGDVAIRVLRIAASDTTRRQGVLVFNPGGPGYDGLDMPAALVLAFSGSNPDHPLGALQLRLLAEFDMVGFSPRGTANSSPLTCATSELARPVDYSLAGLAPQNLQNAFHNAATVAAACGRNPLTPFIQSDATARDMDLLRAVLGEERLHYFGYSYGSWLGAWYASLFPDRVGRMLLDSSWDFTGTMESNYLRHPMSFHRVMEKVLIPYAGRHPQAFGLGTSPSRIQAALLALPMPWQHVLSLRLGDLSYYNWDAEEFAAHIKAAMVTDAVMQATGGTDAARIRQGLDEAVFMPDSEPRDQRLREIAHALFDLYEKRWLAPVQESLTGSPQESTFTAVMCNDTPTTSAPNYWVDRLNEFGSLSPLFYSTVMDNPCIFWSRPDIQKPSVLAMEKLDVMLVQSEFDAPTPKEGADLLFAALPAAHRVYIPGEYQHGVYPYLDDCVDLHVTRYFLGESPAERETVCPAHPLALDQQQAQQRGDARAMVLPAAAAYQNLGRARELIERAKKQNRPPQPRH